MDTPVVGAARPYTLPDVRSIATGRGAQWAYSPQFVNGKLLASTPISLTGSRTRDYQEAEARTGRAHVGRVTVWHHLYDFTPVGDRCTMQLVRYGNHVSTIPHAGGCVAYAEYHRVPYRSVSPEDRQIPAPRAVEAYSAKELEGFCARTGLMLSPALRRFYGGDFQLNQAALGHIAGQDCLLDCILPLRDRDGASLEQVRRDLGGKLPVLAETLAVGMDACGNYFCATSNDGLLFYDHERDQAVDTGLTLQDLMK